MHRRRLLKSLALGTVVVGLAGLAENTLIVFLSDSGGRKAGHARLTR